MNPSLLPSAAALSNGLVVFDSTVPENINPCAVWIVPEISSPDEPDRELVKSTFAATTLTGLAGAAIAIVLEHEKIITSAKNLRITLIPENDCVLQPSP